MNAALALAACALAGACGRAPHPPDQPIAFNHALHLTVELDGRTLQCIDCHAGAERREHAGLPAMRDCLRCHVRPQLGASGQPNPREARVRELAAAGPVRWIQITRNPGHVYAPHRAHVGIAKLACEECHGDVRAWTVPPTEPVQRLLHMTECIACHREHGASTRCGACHR
ncbi:MAG TPA: cytochrome c3 family protein [Kofleriaceae bacterium]|nr:cytochrome c3 family protein [Kofleriaceae bacterium]